MTVVCLTCSLLLGGCGSPQDNASSQSPSQASSGALPQTSSDTASDALPQAPSDAASGTLPQTPSDAASDTLSSTKALTITVANTCGVDIGMFSVLDPVTGEQLNLDSLADEESLSLETSWPVSVTEFQWALYNQQGELCIEGTTDISAADSSVLLVLTGDGDVENVEAYFPEESN